MKKIVLLLTLALPVALAAAAQPYQFSYSTASYTALANPDPVSNGLVWDDEDFLLPIGFPFSFNGTIYNIIEVDADGSIEFPGALDQEIMAFHTDLIDNGAATSLSPISTELLGTAGSRIRVVEWSNAGFADGAPTDFVNFQVWLYEADNSIEIRMGPSSVASVAAAFDGDPGPEVGLIYDGSLAGGAYTGLVLTGPADTPAAQAVTNTTIEHYLTGIGSEGMVYRFGSGSLSVPAAAAKTGLHLYPNPATGLVAVGLPGQLQGPAQVMVYDPLGRQVLQQTAAAQPGTAIDISTLRPGQYMVVVQQQEQRFMQKLVKY